MKVRISFRDTRGRFVKRNARRVQSIEVRQVEPSGKQILLEKLRGRFSEKRAGEIRRKVERKAEAKKAIVLLETPNVPRAESVELIDSKEGIFKVTIRSAKTRTTLHIRKQGRAWVTLKRIRGRN